MKISGTRLEELRIGRDWTQAELAEEAGVARDTVSKLESGARKSAHGPTVGKLAQALDVEPGELCGSPSPTLEEAGLRRHGGVPLVELMEAAGSLPGAYVGALVTNARVLEDEQRYYFPGGPDGDRRDEETARALEGVERKRALLGSVARTLGAYELDMLIRIAGHLMAARLAMVHAEGKVWEEAEAEDLRREESRRSPSAGRPR